MAKKKPARTAQRPVKPRLVSAKSGEVLAPETVGALALAHATPEQAMSIFERAASDKGIDANKLEKLANLQMEMFRFNAEQEFNQAFARMKPHIPFIDKKGRILNKEKHVVSNYSTYEDIQRIVRPIEDAHGFSRNFTTEYPYPDKPGWTRVTVHLRHVGGHVQHSSFQGPPEDSGFKNNVQAMGSTNAYGRRYTTIDVLDIVCEGVDDDGRRGKGQEQKAGDPAGGTEQPRTASNANALQKITFSQDKDKPGQVQRLWTIFRKTRMAGLDKEQGDAVQRAFGAWLGRTYPYTNGSSQEIRKGDYDAIVKYIESNEPFTATEKREPGQDG